MVMGLAAATGCQHGLLVDEADLRRLDECVALQRAQIERLEATESRLLEHLVEMREQIGHGPALRRQLEDLALQVAAVHSEIGRECPEPVVGDAVLAGALDKLVVGEAEDVRLEEPGFVMRARIDTGAATSSLDARDIQIFERDGDNWVRFTILDPDTSEPLVLERPRSRRVRILQAAAEEPERRPVVELRVTLGSVSQTAEFTLADRSGLEFPMLIGRNILRDLMVVDVSKRDAAPLRSRSGEDS